MTLSDAMPRAVLVTGAAARIGRIIAEALAHDGWAVAVHHRESGDAATEVVAGIEDAGGRAVALRADLAEEAQVDTLVARATEALGPLGCLVNNASPFEHDDLQSADPCELGSPHGGQSARALRADAEVRGRLAERR